MRGSWQARFGIAAAAAVLALGALVAGPISQPIPASAAYCDDFPFLCLTYTVNTQGTGDGLITTEDGFIGCQWANGVKSGTCSKRYIKDAQGRVSVTTYFTPASDSYVCVEGGCSSGEQSFQSSFASDVTTLVTFSRRDCSKVNASWCSTLTFAVAGNGFGHVQTADGFMQCNYAAGSATGVCRRDYWVGPEKVAPHVIVTGVANPGSEVCVDTGCALTAEVSFDLDIDYAISVSFSLVPPTPGPTPTATPRPPTPGPSPTGHPATTSMPTIAPGASGPPTASGFPRGGPTLGADPNPSPGESMDGAPSESGGIGSPGGTGSQPTIEPTVPAAGGSSGDSMVLAVAILAGAVVIAVGLAVGLRGRRPGTREDEPAA